MFLVQTLWRKSRLFFQPVRFTTTNAQEHKEVRCLIDDQDVFFHAWAQATLLPLKTLFYSY